MDFQYLFLNGDGRIPRRDFWIGIAILIVANIVLSVVLGAIGSMVGGMWGAIILIGLAGLAMALPGYFLMVKRSNDRDYPQTYVQALTALNIAFQLQAMVLPMTMGGQSLLANLFSIAIALAGLWALVDLGFFQGTRGPNRYGPDPLEVPQT
ncbi:DUF805 domain-containing protein [Phreatobacter oligotrophus]|uniref:DUF805 domain-containing protein n=1 Tax=Phreatobacter oligotrophus TaxID=1122261 RepID=UPI00235213F2|nr:DUF805 domain-containing protein [Phreatobacter oligotrophus]MBX9993100.1 DUF805 domain-containing protein [Phreatobacter oligotrophus]